ncbi:MAG: hypothetical protein SGPRY_009319, partial [Prymnesium sp.]
EALVHAKGVFQLLWSQELARLDPPLGSLPGGWCGAGAGWRRCSPASRLIVIGDQRSHGRTGAGASGLGGLHLDEAGGIRTPRTPP